MKILMFGWEFPPYNSGGLGVACQGLTKALSQEGIEIVFVLPKKFDCQFPYCRFIFANENFVFKNLPLKGLKNFYLNSLLNPYLTPKFYAEFLGKILQEKNLSQTDFEIKSLINQKGLFEEIMRYAFEARKIALLEDFDIIHAHDWLTFPAGIEAKKISKKPLVAHIHATEFDRTGGHGVNKKVYQIEKRGFEEADVIIAVSQFTKEKVVKHYNISPEKIKVVYNATDYQQFNNFKNEVFGLKKAGKKIVLFLGRITLQKGPDYFLLAAKKVLEKDPNVIFIVAGSGDMERKIIELSAQWNIADKVLFAGFLRGKEQEKIYQMADLYVLPSVSEPFGITPLEALSFGAPVLISKQSGVSEVISHCLKVDFWDINDMANKILAVLNYNELKESLSENGQKEVKKLSWQESARQCCQIYQTLIA